MPNFIIGVINLRGNVISVMDARKRFNLGQRDYDDRTCIIVVDVNELKIGLVVDTVNEVSDISEENVDPPPKTHAGVKSQYIRGLGKVDNQVKILLDISSILQDEEVEQLKQK